MARSRELRVVISGDTSSLNRAFARAGTGAQALEGRVGRASTGIGRHLGTMAKIGTAAVGVGLVGALKGSIDAFAEAQKVATQTNAVLKSTGGAANVSAKQVSGLASAISRKSGMDDEAIQSGENLLLTFTKLRNEQGKGNDIFTQATSIMADMSTALGQDTKSSAIQLGKALNDPVKGVTALQRVGVSFTKSQKEQITTLVESGRTLDAQKLILKELRTEFGGSAEAAGTTFAGKINKAKVAVGNLGEAIGGALAPALGAAADKLAGFVDKLATSDRPAKFFDGLKARADDAKTLFSNLFEDIGRRRGQGASLGGAIGGSFSDAVSRINWSEIGDKISSGLSGALKVSGDVSRNVEDGIRAAFSNIDGAKVLGGLVDAIGEAIDALFSPRFWIEHFEGIFATVTLVIPVAKILKIPGAGVLYNWISRPFFNAVGRFGSALVGLFQRVGSRAFTTFLAEVERFAPRVANAMLRLATGGVGAIRRFPAQVAAIASRAVGGIADRIGDGIGRAAAAMARLVAGLLRPFASLGSRVATAIGRALAAGTAKMGAWVRNFADAAVQLGRAIVDGIVRGVKSTAGRIGSAITGGFGAVAKFVTGKGEGVGKKVGGLPPIKGVGGLDGANPIMGVFAGEGSRFGLHVSSGRSSHSTFTATGNVSYHSTGEAIDLANGRGPDAAKMRAAKYLASKYGSRLAELIYSPMGFSIKDGKRVAPYAVKDHYDHVHVALDTGRPGPGDGWGRRRPFVGDGIGQAVSAARRAGFKGSSLVQAVAIAGAESTWRNSAKNLVPPDHSIGMWQINQLAHHGRFGSDAQLQDADRNARAAWVISGHGRNWGPWSTWPRAAAGFMARARQAVVGSRGATPRRSGGGGGGGGGGLSISQQVAAAGETARNTVRRQGGSSIAPPTHEQLLANTDVALAESTGNQAATVGALTMRRNVLNTRLFKVTAALGKRTLTPATRLRLTQERAQLLGDIGQTNTDLFTAAAPPAAAEEVGDQDNPLVEALKALAEEQEKTRQATEEHTQALRETRDALDRQTKFGQSVQATESFQLKRALADVLSGALGARGMARAYTPGFGTEVRF